MAVFRFLAAVFLLVATIALVVDATPAVYGAGGFQPTALATHWNDLGKSSFEAARSSLSEAAPWLWDGLVAPLLDLPTFVIFGLLALLAGYIGRRRRTVRLFVN